MVAQITVQAGISFQVMMDISIENSQDDCRVYLGEYGGRNQ